MQKVFILATGGTIAGQGEPGKSLNYRPGNLQVEELLSVVPGIGELADILCIQVAALNSDDLTASHWLNLARIIEEQAQKEDTAGFVITHGTDTLEETAYFLHLVLKTRRPVVLTGSMRPATALSADGPANLYGAVALAASEEAVGRGVMVVSADRIYGAREVQKVSTFALDAFDGRDFGCLGYMLDGHPYFYQRSLSSDILDTVFSVQGLDKLPRVEILFFALDASPELISWAAQRADGLVLAGAGNGNYSLLWNEQVQRLQARHFPVVRCSRIGNGQITPDDAFDSFSNVIRAGNLPPQKAKILLQLALTYSRDLDEIRRIFDRY